MRVSIVTLGIGAMVVATAWALLSQGPVVERAPYPLPATAAAPEEPRDAQPKTVFAPEDKMKEQARIEQEQSDSRPQLSTVPEPPASLPPAREVGSPATGRSIKFVRSDSRH
jgi:hypothetical protein